MAANNEVIEQMERMIINLALSYGELEREAKRKDNVIALQEAKISELFAICERLEKRLTEAERADMLTRNFIRTQQRINDEVNDTTERLTDDVALLDDRTQPLNKEGRRCSD